MRMKAIDQQKRRLLQTEVKIQCFTQLRARPEAKKSRGVLPRATRESDRTRIHRFRISLREKAIRYLISFITVTF